MIIPLHVGITRFRMMINDNKTKVFNLIREKQDNDKMKESSIMGRFETVLFFC